MPSAVEPTPCPKCGAPITGEECARCGLLLSKWRESGAQRRPSAREQSASTQAAPAKKRQPPGSWPLLLFVVSGAVATLAAAVVWETAPTSVQQIASLVLSLIAAVYLVGAAVVYLLRRLLILAENRAERDGDGPFAG